MQTTLVIPCYNEEDRLPVESFRSFLANADVRLIFVDDGSTDCTYSILKKLHAAFKKNTELLQLSTNSGKAEAVRRGMLQAYETNSDYAGYWDADLATPFTELNRFIEKLQKTPSVKIVTGARVALLGRNISRQNFRHYTGRIIGTFISAILNTPVYDTQCGAKLFRTEAITRKLFETPFETGWLFDVELLQRLQNQGTELSESVYELPLNTWIDQAGSKIKLHHFFGVLLDFLRLCRIRQH